MDADLTLRVAMGLVFLLVGLTLSFMAYALVLHMRAKRVEARKRALQERWRNHLLAAGTGEGLPNGSGQDPLPPVAERDRILLLDLITEYARAVDGPERKAVVALAAPHLEALDPLLDEDDPYERAYALDLLGELGYDQARERLARGLDDPSGLVAMVAARAFARQGDPEYVPLILARLHAFQNWSPGYLASLLAGFGSDASPALRTLATDPYTAPRLRAVAFQALRELNDTESVPRAVRMLPEEGDPEVQAEMIRLVGELGSPEQLASVRAYAASPAPFVRAAAIRAISSLSDRRTSDLETVARGLDDPSPWVALQAAHGLVDLGRRDELEHLAESRSPRAELAAEVLESRR
jgi:HEAT repeat protein